MPQAKTYGHRLPPVEVPDEMRSRLERVLEELQRLHVAGVVPYGPWNLSNIMRVALGFGLRPLEQEVERFKRDAGVAPTFAGVADSAGIHENENVVRAAGTGARDLRGFVPHVPQEVLDAAKAEKPARPKGRQIGPGRKPR